MEFSPLTTICSKPLCFRVVKTWDSVVKSQSHTKQSWPLGRGILQTMEKRRKCCLSAFFLPQFSTLSNKITIDLVTCKLLSEDHIFDLSNSPFENTVGKGEIAGNQHFLLFLQCFLLFLNQISILESHSFVKDLNLDRSKILLFGRELQLCTRTGYEKKCFNLK